MAQRSIMSFFGAKSPPAQKVEQAGRTISTDSMKQVLKSPVNSAKSKKTESPIKLSSPLSEKKDQLMLEESPVASPTKSVSDKSDEMCRHSENSVPDVVKTRKRPRILSSSSESSKSSSDVDSNEEADEVVSIHSLSTDYNDIEMRQVKNSPESKIETKEKKNAVETKKATTKKTKTPAKKTPAKSAKLSSPKKMEKEEDKSVVAVDTKKSPKKRLDSPKVEPKTEPKSANGSKQEYDPMQEKYDPVTSATWKENDKTPFLCLARTLDCAEKTSSRLRTMETVANFFASIIRLSPVDLPATVYLCLGVIAPAHLGIETSVGEGVLLKAMAQATGRPIAKIRADLQQKGDIGEVAEQSRNVQRQIMFAAKPQPLTISGVFTKLQQIAAMQGQNSQTNRVDQIARLLTTCQPVEAKFLIRLLIGKLRVGLAEQSVLIALAHSAVYAKCVTKKDRAKYWEDKQVLDKVAKNLRLAFANCPDVDRIVKALKEAVDSDEEDFIQPFLELPRKCHIIPGLPVKPMLAQPAKSMHEVVEKLGAIAKEESAEERILACEYKYDGERAQIHIFYKENETSPTVKIYSRNQEDHTVRFQEVANRIATEAVLEEARGKSIIIDSEIVAVDSNGRHLPFQMLAARKRKEQTEEEKAKDSAKAPSVPLYQAIAFVFDCFYIDGKSLVDETLLERRRLVRQCIKPIDGLVEWAKSLEVDLDKQEHEVEEKITAWLEESVKEGTEGLIVKTASSKYMVARRAPCWLKLKKDYIDCEGGAGGMGGDSVDLVVIAGYWGAGKRTGRLGAFLLASYDPLDDQYETVCKLGTGLSDEMLDQLTEQLMPLAKPQGAPPPSYIKRSPALPEPNVWLEPSVVWEIRAADLSLSNVHTSGLGSIPGAPDRGVSLRFPRYIRSREDKKPEEATTSEAMCMRYSNQQQVQHASEKKGKVAVDDDFY